MRRLLIALALLMALASCAQAEITPWMREQFSAAYPETALDDLIALVLLDSETPVELHARPENLCIIAQRADSRRLIICETANGAFLPAVSSHPLPNDAFLDTIHPGPHSVQVEFSDAHGHRIVEFHQPQPGGMWMLDWINVPDDVFPLFYAGYSGISRDPLGRESMRYGAHPWLYFESIDFASLPATFEEALTRLDQSPYAVVSNPDPKDRLHLREKPDTGARSLGKFYNGTPVRVHDVSDGWARVSFGGTPSGFMMTKYLAFGEAMNAVESAFPELVPLDKYSLEEKHVKLTTQPKGEGYASELTGDYLIIGAYGDDDYILLLRDGRVYYSPQSEFFPGNG